MNAHTFTKLGTKATTTVKLPGHIFDLSVDNHELLKSVYLAYYANSRENLARTKTRAMVRGGGRKPWKQKGTGRARFGSIRVPIWRGGGIAFGPTGSENYTHKVNTGSKRVALCQALSLKQKAGKIIVIEDLQLDGKTKSCIQLLSKLSLDQKNTILVVNSKTPQIIRSTNNVKNITLKAATYLNAAIVMDADSIVFTKDALNIFSDLFIQKNSSAKNDSLGEKA